MANFGWIWFVIALPVMGFLIQALLGKRIVGDGSGKRLAGFLAVAPIAAAFGLAVKITMDLAAIPEGAREVVSPGWNWIQIAGLNVPFELRVDPLTMMMTL